ncbi:hypothetical protein CXG81DRAFT_19896 [Caulochytrium protostelioides]|uniref:AAA+ ATPase domain-containing protein n=1 Tax=Caulochytrium protostelioides TaxID=1555241 RepID=A0A4P9X4S7_9FUNG|nr:hypothetical protein CXG81DRAFT_19896 [Caulochytrium protostelioides]|eukprot:RKP00097.1 hypothetical protein CXG81DRAFT_19896 [Caulochytrium protostelioides]
MLLLPLAREGSRPLSPQPRPLAAAADRTVTLALMADAASSALEAITVHPADAARCALPYGGLVRIALPHETSDGSGDGSRDGSGDGDARRCAAALVLRIELAVLPLGVPDPPQRASDPAASPPPLPPPPVLGVHPDLFRLFLPARTSSRTITVAASVATRAPATLPAATFRVLGAPSGIDRRRAALLLEQRLRFLIWEHPPPASDEAAASSEAAAPASVTACVPCAPPLAMLLYGSRQPPHRLARDCVYVALALPASSRPGQRWTMGPETLATTTFVAALDVAQQQAPPRLRTPCPPMVGHAAVVQACRQQLQAHAAAAASPSWRWNDPFTQCQILAGPGSGKTTFAAHVALALDAWSLLLDGRALGPRDLEPDEAPQLTDLVTLRAVLAPLRDHAPPAPLVVVLDHADAMPPPAALELLQFMDDYRRHHRQVAARAPCLLIATASEAPWATPVLASAFSTTYRLLTGDAGFQQQLLAAIARLPDVSDVPGVPDAHVPAVLVTALQTRFAAATPADLVQWVHRTFAHYRRQLTWADLVAALPSFTPAGVAAIAQSVPAVDLMADVHGLPAATRTYLAQAVVTPLRWALQERRAHGVAPVRGVLLHGPAGSGKSHVAYALIAALGLPCIAVSAGTLRSKVLGDTERLVTDLFARARAAAPCVLLLDGIDILFPRRNATGVASLDERLTSLFLTELDGLGAQTASSSSSSSSSSSMAAAASGMTLVMATAASREAVDAALLRPGRIEVHVGLAAPDADGRAALLRHAFAERPHTLAAADWSALSAAVAGWMPAEIAALGAEAGLVALRASIETRQITRAHVDRALQILQTTMRAQSTHVAAAAAF